MAAVTQPNPVPPPAHTAPTGATHPTSQLAQALPGFDPDRAINAHEMNLADYLNQPVHDILARLGLPPAPTAVPPNPSNTPAPNAAGPTPNTPQPAGSANPIDPSALIQPVTDALGTLGSGQFGDLDPAQMFQGISQAFESAGQSVGQAMSGLDAVWQGDAASAATAKTSAALTDGTEVARQSTDLSDSLSTAVASVAAARARLIAIVNEFWAKIAAIGPNIIFPWGMAAAIEAASEAVTEAAEVITDTQGTLGAQAGHVTATGAPVAVTSAPKIASDSRSFASPAGATAAPALGAPAIGPVMQMASSLGSPVMDGVSAVTGAVQAGISAAPGPQAATEVAGGTLSPGIASRAALSGAGGGGAGVGGIPTATMQSRLAAAEAPAVSDTTAAVESNTAATVPTGAGGSSMLGGAPMSQAVKGGTDKGHNAASFLHTSDRGDEVVGNLGNVAPSVIGEVAASNTPDIDLRI
jgi:hypothetical protein